MAIKKSLKLDDGRRFGTLVSHRSSSQHGFKFVDALLALQKKGFRLVDAKELSDLTSHPDFPAIMSKQKHVGDETYASNGWVYLPNGDMLVTSGELDPVIARYDQWVNSFTPDSFPDSPKYAEAIREAARQEDERSDLMLSSPDKVPSVLQRYHIMRDPIGTMEMLRPIINYGKENDIGIVLPMQYDERVFHTAEETKTKEGEPYFISRIKNASRIYNFGGNLNYVELSQGELEKLLGVATEDPEKARESGVLLVRRNSIDEEVKTHRFRREDRVIGSKVVYAPEAVIQEPITRFLYGESVNQVAEQLKDIDKPLRVHLTYMQKLGDVKVGVPVQLKVFHQGVAFDTEYYSMGGNDHIPIQAQIFGVK